MLNVVQKKIASSLSFANSPQILTKDVAGFRSGVGEGFGSL